ncbi:MAG: hypothetical protein WB615_09830 [Candidatus Tumulicola sp.]
MKRHCVRDLHGPVDEAALTALPYDACLQWRRPLPAGDLARVVRWLSVRPNAALRLYGAACEQIETLAAGVFLPARLTLEAARLSASVPALPGVRDLALEGTPADPAAVLAAAPALETLQVDCCGGAFDLAVLANVPNLQRLSLAAARVGGVVPWPAAASLRAVELRNCNAASVAGVLALPGLRALRLSAIGRLRSIEALAGHASLRALCLESLVHLDSLQALATLPALESLDIAGLWQFSVAEAGFMTSMSGLRRLAVDIGGRRKNVEIYKKLQLPKPPPFDIRDDSYDLTMV